MKKSQLKQIIREEIRNSLNEEFRKWKVIFQDRGIYDGVEVKYGHAEVVKARSTAEAIKKASKKVGLKGDAWALINVKVLFA